jgi:hypothetical protein
MPGAYELNLILRGRNYLSNDLRKASADIRGLSRGNALSSLASQRSQLSINAQRLATTKQIAQNEQQSIQTGSRRIALEQRAANLLDKQQIATTKLRDANLALTASQEAQVANASKLAEVNASLATRQDIGSMNYAALRENQQKLIQVDQELITEQVRLAASAEDAEAAVAKLGLAEQKLAADTTRAAQRNAVLTDKINTTSVALDLNSKKLAENELATERASSRLNQYGLVAEHVGRTFQTFGLIATAAAAGAAFTASKFSTGGVLAATQLANAGSNSPAQLQRIGANVNSQLLKFMASGQSVSSAADLQTAAYNIPSGIPSLRGDSNQKAKETIALIKEFNQVAKANYGLVDLNGVTNAGIILINTFGTSIGRLPHEFDVMQSAVNRGKVTLGEFVSGLSQTAPAAKAAGYNFDSMASVLSFLSGKLPQYTRVAVGYARALELFQNKKFEDYMKSKGAAITDLTGKLLPYNQIIQQILKVDPSLAKAGNLISFLKTASGASGFMQARRVLTVSLQDQAGLNRAVQQVPQNAQGLVNASATALSQTGAVKWKELTTQLKAFAIVIGQGVIPVFQKLATPLEAAVKSFNQLSPSTRHLVGEIAAFVAVGALLGGTLLMIVGGLARAVLSLKTLRGTRASGLLGAEAGFTSAGVAMKLGLLGAIIIALPLLVKYHSQILNLIGGLKGLASILSGLATAFALIKLSNFALGLDALTSSASRTETEMIQLRKTLLLLKAIGTIAIVLSFIPKSSKGQTVLDREGMGALGKLPVIGGLITQSANVGNDIRKVIGRSDLTKSTALAQGNIAQMNKVIANLETLRPPGWLAQVAELEGIITKLNKNTSGMANDPLHDVFSHPIVKGVTRTGAPPPFTDANVTAAAKNIAKLDELADKNPTIANYEKAAAALKDLQSKAGADQFAAAQQLISALESAQTKADNKQISAAKKKHNKLLAEEKKAAAERLQALKDAESNVNSMYDSILSQNQSVMGQLFSGPYTQSPTVQNRLQYGGQLTGSDYLKDLKSQTSQFRTFYSQIGKLQKRGAPQELVQQLIQAGPSALPAIKALSSMGSKQWDSYIKVFNQGQKLLHNQTIKQLTEQLKDYRKYGNKIAFQIISGMRDKRVGLTGELKKLIENMFGVSVPVVHGASTTKTLADAGKVAKAHAATKAASAYTGSTTHSKPVIGTGTRTTQGIIVNHNYNVTAPTSEHASVKVQLRHAEFARKTKIGINP